MKTIVNYTILTMLLLSLAVALPAGESTAKKPDPQEALKLLKAGNLRFHTGTSQHPHITMERLKLAGESNQADYVYATVLSCSDSRVPVELIFDAGVMDIFTVRVAGNVCNVDERGSIEYGLAHVNTPVLVVLGHSKCGAVSAVAGAVHGNVGFLERSIPPLIDSIKPAVYNVLARHPDIKGDAVIPFAIKENVYQSIRNLFMYSPATRILVRDKKVIVIGAVYDVGTGKIEWLPENESDRILKEVLKDRTRELWK